MSQGTIIGIAVGVGGGVLFIVAAAFVFWFLRRSRKSQAARDLAASELGSGTGTGTLSPGPGSEAGGLKAQAVMQQRQAVYEIDGRLFRVEMASDTGKFELDSAGHGNAELASNAADALSAPTEETATASTSPETKTVSVSPVSPLTDTHTPQSPPPEYTPASPTGGDSGGQSRR
jgi:hypothetical protein